LNAWRIQGRQPHIHCKPQDVLSRFDSAFQYPVLWNSRLIVAPGSSAVSALAHLEEWKGHALMGNPLCIATATAAPIDDQRVASACDS
jgi:hypothetical protein